MNETQTVHRRLMSDGRGRAKDSDSTEWPGTQQQQGEQDAISVHVATVSQAPRVPGTW